MTRGQAARTLGVSPDLLAALLIETFDLGQAGHRYRLRDLLQHLRETKVSR